MNQCRLNLCSWGEPTNPKTWSGTPFRIYTELTRADKCDRVFDAAPQPDGRSPVWAVPCFLREARAGPGPLQPLFLLIAGGAKNKVLGIEAHFARRDVRSAVSQAAKGPKALSVLRLDLELVVAICRVYAPYPPRLQSAAERLEKLAYDQVDHIFPTSNYVRENLIHHYGVSSQKITVVGTGPGVIHPFSGPKDYSNGRVLFVAKGRFQDKGGDLVLAAFRRAVGKNPKLRLTIVGDNDYLALAKEPGVTTLGHVPIPDLQELFNSHTLFLMPAPNEPWGLVYLEAMLCRMPIMGLNRNAFPEMSGHGRYGFMLEDPDPGAIAEKLVEAYRSPARLEELGAAAHDHCSRRFSWEKTVTLMLKTIDERAA